MSDSDSDVLSSDDEFARPRQRQGLGLGARGGLGGLGSSKRGGLGGFGSRGGRGGSRGGRWSRGTKRGLSHLSQPLSFSKKGVVQPDKRSSTAEADSEETRQTKQQQEQDDRSQEQKQRAERLLRKRQKKTFAHSLEQAQQRRQELAGVLQAIPTAISDEAEDRRRVDAEKARQERGERPDRDFGRFQGASIGMKLMQKMGFRGRGLGKYEQGRVNPVKSVMRPQGAGLGAAAVDVVEEEPTQQEEPDVFAPQRQRKRRWKTAKELLRQLDREEHAVEVEEKPSTVEIIDMTGKQPRRIVRRVERGAEEGGEEADLESEVREGYLTTLKRNLTLLMDLSIDEARRLRTRVVQLKAANARETRRVEATHGSSLAQQHSRAKLLCALLDRVLAKFAGVDWSHVVQQGTLGSGVVDHTVIDDVVDVIDLSVDSASVSSASSAASASVSRRQKMVDDDDEFDLFSRPKFGFHSTTSSASSSKEAASFADLEATLYAAVHRMQSEFEREYAEDGIHALVAQLVLPMFGTIFAAWQPFLSDGISTGTVLTLLRRWKPLLLVGSDKRHDTYEERETTVFATLVDGTVLPKVRSLCAQLEDLRNVSTDAQRQHAVRQSDVLCRLLRVLLAPHCSRIDVRRLCLNTLLPRVLGVVRTVPPQAVGMLHEWLRPWLREAEQEQFLRRADLDAVLAQCAQQLAKALRRWDGPQDDTVRVVLHHWRPPAALPPRAYTRLLRDSVCGPIRRYAKKHLHVDPAAQDAEPWLCILRHWHLFEHGDADLFIEILQQVWWPRWLQALFHWLAQDEAASKVHFGEVAQWYQGWLDTLPASLLARTQVQEMLACALDLCNLALDRHARGDRPLVPLSEDEFLDVARSQCTTRVQVLSAAERQRTEYLRTVRQLGKGTFATRDASARELLEQLALRKGVEFVPLPQQADGRRVWRLGAAVLVHFGRHNDQVTTRRLDEPSDAWQHVASLESLFDTL
ncbi:MAG: hypothetical protein MHM6MM_003203 [Cercozoa sp. M6MM]